MCLESEQSKNKSQKSDLKALRISGFPFCLRLILFHSSGYHLTLYLCFGTRFRCPGVGASPCFHHFHFHFLSLYFRFFSTFDLGKKNFLVLLNRAVYLIFEFRWLWWCGWWCPYPKQFPPRVGHEPLRSYRLES